MRVLNTKKNCKKKIEKIKHQVKALAKKYKMCKPDNEEILESCGILKHQIKDIRRKNQEYKISIKGAWQKIQDVQTM